MRAPRRLAIRFRAIARIFLAQILLAPFLLTLIALALGVVHGQAQETGSALPSSGTPSSGTPSMEPSASVLVVRPAGWEEALGEWIAYRTPAYRIVQVEARPNAYEQRIAILEAAAACSPKATAVLLCGDVARQIAPGTAADAPLAGAGRRGQGRFEILVPGMVLDTTVKLGPLTTDELCTDAPYGDLDGDGCPELAVGRIPAKSPDELKRMLHRSLIYESAAPGPWNDTLHVTAGVGGFGVVADTAIEAVTRRFLTEGIPDHFRLNMTYASCTSTYCPNPFRIRDAYIDRINSGGLFWVYIGHGAVTHLDYMQAGNQWLPLGDANDAGRFRIRSRPPIAILLACFTGAYDANVDCFAESLLAQDSGPVAVIAGSRVTMPYGLSQLASEMINGCFRDRLPTLGQVVVAAKRRIWLDDALDASSAGAAAEGAQRIDIRKRYRKIVTDMAMALSPEDHDLLEERREHVRLMNLLGDPLLQLPYPIDLGLQAPAQSEPGAQVIVRGVAPFAGTVRIDLSLVRDRLPEGVVPLAAYEGTAAQHQQMEAIYESSQELTVASVEQNVAPGAFEVAIDLPTDVKGRCVLSGYLYGDSTWAVGSQRISIRKPK